MSDVYERINSIDAYIRKSCRFFCGALPANERANMSHEDAYQDCILALVERDKKYDPSRGRYLSWASRLISRELVKIRDRSRTVSSPRDAFARLHQLRAPGATERMRETAARIASTIRPVLPLVDEIQSDKSDPDWAAQSAEEDSHRTTQAAALLLYLEETLGPLHRAVVAATYGLQGMRQLPDSRISRHTGLTTEEIAVVRSEAIAQMRRFFSGVEHGEDQEEFDQDF